MSNVPYQRPSDKLIQYASIANFYSYYDKSEFNYLALIAIPLQNEVNIEDELWYSG